MRHGSADAGGTFHRPAALRETLAPTLQSPQALSVGRESFVREELPVLVDGPHGVHALVGIHPYEHPHATPSSTIRPRSTVARGGHSDFGSALFSRPTPLLSHSARRRVTGL